MSKPLFVNSEKPYGRIKSGHWVWTKTKPKDWDKIPVSAKARVIPEDRIAVNLNGQKIGRAAAGQALSERISATDHSG